MKEEIVLKTVEDLVKFTLQNSRATSDRYQLEENYADEWIDEAKGKAFEEELAQLGGYIPFNDPKRPQYDVLMEKRPKVKRVTHYYFSRSSRHFYSTTIKLSDDLGKLIDSIWTKRPAWRGSEVMRNAGTMTLPGILKRLGNTSVGAKIKEAQGKEKAESEKRARNYTRKQIREAAQKLQKLLSESGSLLSTEELTIAADLYILVDLKDEE